MIKCGTCNTELPDLPPSTPPSKEFYLDKIKQWAFKLHDTKWWKPAIVKRIILAHYVDKYLEAQEEDFKSNMAERLLRMRDELSFGPYYRKSDFKKEAIANDNK